MFEVYADKAGGWRWRLRTANGRIIADSAEAYTRERDAWRAISTVIVTVEQVGRLAIRDPDEPNEPVMEPI